MILLHHFSRGHHFHKNHPGIRNLIHCYTQHHYCPKKGKKEEEEEKVFNNIEHKKEGRGKDSKQVWKYAIRQEICHLVAVTAELCSWFH